MKIGSIIAWGSDTIPDGWLLCDGSAVSRTTYANLFAVIGTNFGIGDGDTTFNLPDLRGRVGVGKSNDTEFDTLGETGGSKFLQEHNHIIEINGGTATGVGDGYLAGSNNYAKVNYATSNTGAGDSGNLQPYIVTNYIIKALIEDKVKISELENAINIDGTEVMPIVQNGVTKKITASNLLNDVYDAIEEVYSTDEVKTNKVWIDGKPIYRKAVSIPEFSTTAVTVETGLTTVDRIVNFEGSFQRKNYTQFYPLDNIYIGEWAFNVSNGQIVIGTNNQYVTFTNGYIILEYTKTTD